MKDRPTDASEFGWSYWRSAATHTTAIDPPHATALSTTRLRWLADNIPTLCWIANGGGYIFWYNRRWHEYCGTTAEQMEGWGWRSVHDPAALDAVMERWTHSIATGEPFEMTFRSAAPTASFVRS